MRIWLSLGSVDAIDYSIHNPSIASFASHPFAFSANHSILKGIPTMKTRDQCLYRDFQASLT